METKIKFKGISPKIIKDKAGDEEEIFITKFEAVNDSWEDALETKKVIENKLPNVIKGQKTLK